MNKRNEKREDRNLLGNIIETPNKEKPKVNKNISLTISRGKSSSKLKVLKCKETGHGMTKFSCKT